MKPRVILADDPGDARLAAQALRAGAGYLLKQSAGPRCVTTLTTIADQLFSIPDMVSGTLAEYCRLRLDCSRRRWSRRRGRTRAAAYLAAVRNRGGHHGTVSARTPCCNRVGCGMRLLDIGSAAAAGSRGVDDTRR